MPAARTAEHPWLGLRSKVAPRRRAARAEVAAVSTERAACEAARHKARLQSSSACGQAVATMSASAAGAIATAAAALSEITHMSAAMSAEARAAREDAKRWEKVAVDAESAAAGGGSRDDGSVSAFAAIAKAEAAVQRTELLAREAAGGLAVAATAARSLEQVMAQEASVKAGGAKKALTVVDRGSNNATEAAATAGTRNAVPEMKDSRAAVMALGAGKVLRE